MGSAASSSVQVCEKTDDNDACSSESNLRANVGAEHEGDGRPRSTVSGRGASAKRKTRVMPVAEGENGTVLEAAESKVKSAQNQITQMEKQLAELESHNLDLEDRVDSLQQHIAVLEGERSTSDLTQTLTAKDQYIQQLEKQTEDVQTEIAKLKRKYKRKLRALNTSLSEAKQGQTVQAFELKDELQRLTEENKSLAEKLRRQPNQEESNSAEPSAHVDSRTQIIVELSAQVSEQDARITELENQLVEKDRIIQELQGRVGTPRRRETRESSAGSTHGATQSYVPRWRSSVEPSASTEGCSLVGGSWKNDENSQSKQIIRHEDGQGEMGKTAQEAGSYQKSQSAGNARARRRNDRSGGDYRESSGISRDSGIVALTESASVVKKSSVESESDHSDWGDSEPDDQNQAGSNQASGCNTELDPYSIRRISAAKMRKKTPDSSRSSQGSYGSTPSTKPPILRANKNTFDNDLDNLLSSLGTYDTGVKAS